VLEIGCGVGAQMCILARRWPFARLIGVDRSESQLARARAVLRDLIASGRAELRLAPGDALPLANGAVDAICVFWVFEHVSNPTPILAEALRVLKPGGRCWATEVFDRALFTAPACPAIDRYFAAFTALQREFGGDPDVGMRMPGLMAAAGFVDIGIVDVSPTLDWRMSDPAGRQAFIAYFRHLLLNGAAPLVHHGRIPADLPERVAAEFDQLRDRPDSVFSYGAKQIVGRRSR
jgi:SAM-dependent methyltransferase